MRRAITVGLVFLAALAASGPAEAATTVLRPDGDVTSQWGVTGSTTAWNALDDAVARPTSVSSTDYMYGCAPGRVTEVSLQTLAMSGEAPSTSTPSRAWFFGNTASGTTITAAVVANGSVLGSTTVAGGQTFAWRSVDFFPASQAAVDDLRLRFTISLGSACSNVRAAYAELVTETVTAPPPPGDVTPPETAIANGPSDVDRSGIPTFTFTSEPGATFQCRVGAAAFAACASPFAVHVPNGSRSFEVRAVDASGNVDPTPSRRTWWADGLVTNGTFETPMDGWSRVGYAVAGWVGSGATISQVSGGVSGGKGRVVANAAGAYYSLYSYPRAINASVAGTTYTAAAKVRSERPNHLLCLVLKERDATNQGASSQRCLRVGTEWTDLPAVTHTPATSGNELEVGISSADSSLAAGEAYEVDAVTLRDGGPVRVVPAGTATGDPVLLATADVALCDSSGDEAVARLVDTLPGILAIAGDTEQNDGRAEEYTGCYESNFGRHKARTRPAIGDHEYRTTGATGYWDYFGAAAGPRDKGWYSYDVGSWHVVVLNSNCTFVAGCGEGSEQYEWLKADLLANAKACTAAYFHHPLFSAGTLHGSKDQVKPFWDLLYSHGAELVWGGNDHTYQRFARQTPEGVANPVHGIRQFVVGTGGALHYKLGPPLPNTQVQHTGSFGVLGLTLRNGSYDWRFHAQSGRSFTDAGTEACSTTRPDVTPPQVAITAPAAEATVRGTVTLAADASDDRAVESVEFLIDGAVVGTDTTAPYSVTWSSASVANGPVALVARAKDSSSNTASSAPRTIRVGNDTGPTEVRITAPTGGATVSGTIAVNADATDIDGVARVDFYVGGAPLGSDATAPYSVAWDTRKTANGAATITARATDLAGGAATSAPATVTVSNVADQPPVNLLPNPGFESSTSGWTGYRATLSRVAGGHAGAYSGRVTWGSTGTSYSVITSPRPVSPSPAGRMYAAGAAVKAATGRKVCLRIREWGPSGAIGGSQTCVTGTGAWVEFPAVRYTALGGDSLDVYAFRDSTLTSGDSFDLDAVSLITE